MTICSGLSAGCGGCCGVEALTNGAVTSKAEAVNTQSDFFSDFIEFLLLVET
ncbi:exported hypothetical protein [Vibrio crassostreae]|uniref:Uncharacterized protein n=1 Tax=Vibrio crassostreae TaxID=246167 RepID=A0A822MZ98_9VIBR|nr:exported hypothetical protein [Vibrio crassostreae]